MIDQDLLVDREPVTYTAVAAGGGNTFLCPVPDCEGEAQTKWGLR